MIFTKAKSIFTKTKIPSCKFVLNPYVGCEHACLYCYAKFLCRWKNHSKWGSWVEVKENAPELVKGKHVRDKVCMSSVSDAYQPIEKKLLLTRRVLENMDKRTNLSILTKSGLVTRDIDVFVRFERIEVGLTVNGFDEGVRRVLEPKAPKHEKRVDALKTLREEDIKNYAFISPFIPELVDLEAIMKETKSFVDRYWVEFLNLGVAGQEFVRWLMDNYPEVHTKLNDKKEVEKIINEIKDILKENKAKVAGIVTHHTGFKVMS